MVSTVCTIQVPTEWLQLNQSQARDTMFALYEVFKSNYITDNKNVKFLMDIFMCMSTTHCALIRNMKIQHPALVGELSAH